MPEYHYSNDPKDTYTTLLSVGTKSSPGLHATTQREVWTDDGDDTKSNAPFQLAMDAMQMQGTRRIEFNDAGTYMYSSAGTVLDLVSDGDINLSAAVDINIPTGVGLVFGADTEKIEGTTGSNLLALTAAGALNITGGAASTWKTTAGAILIDSEAAALTLDGHAGVNIAGTNGSEVDITTTGLVDINSATLDIDASGAITIDTSSTLSIDVTGGASNITSATDATAEDFTIALTGATNSSLILSSTGTATDALQMTASAGGINISATGSAGKDIDIVNTGGSVNISATEDLANAIVLYATTGGIDLIADGAAGKDIDLTCVNGSINITSGEDIANAIYLHADAGTSETVKIHADQSTAIKSIELLSDLGGIDIQAGKTGAITNMTSGSDDSDFTAAPIKIGTTTANVDIAIGHGTSDVHIGGNLKVAENLYVVGAQSFSALTVSHADDPILTIDNDEQAGSGGGHCTIIFSGTNSSGAAVAQRAKIVVDHPGGSADQKGDMYFYTNSGSQGTSPGAALRLLADSSAVFYDSVSLYQTKKLIFDGDSDSDTYIHEQADDKLDIVVGNQTILEIAEGGGGASDSVSIQALNKLYFDGGGNTYVHEASADKVDVVVGGQTILELSEGGGGASDYAAVQALNKVYFDGGGNTYVQEAAADRLDVVVGGDANGFSLAESGGITRLSMGTLTPPSDATLVLADSQNGAVPAVIELIRLDSDIASSNLMGQIRFSGSEDGGSTYGSGAATITCTASQNWAVGSAEGTNLIFLTTKDSTTGSGLVMTLSHEGHLALSSAVHESSDNFSVLADDSDDHRGLRVKDNDDSGCDSSNILVDLDFAQDADLDAAKFITFQDSDGEIGSISGDGAATTFATSSDYRLKTDLKDIDDATGTINKLKLYDFAWKKNAGKRSHGVLAHEAVEVVPHAISGEKDAMTTKQYQDKDGKEHSKEVMAPQSADYSKFVPLLLKSIQELSAKVEALENK